MNARHLKIVGYVLVSVFVLNILLFSLRIISSSIFWIVLILGAGFVYWGLPRLKNNRDA
ncbi:hypothetical protein HY495_04040 [Candidatus Woesearchaeota archaeon]|nr:hypothetical protein [Candidatus Woesearchaeota archaeon]